MRNLCILSFCVLGVLSQPAVSSSKTAHGQDKVVVGWIEKVTLSKKKLMLHAKVDTGADNSSIDAHAIVETKRGGQTWVKFTVVNRDGRKMVLHRRLVRRARIKKKTGGRQIRPVVEVKMCFGGKLRVVQANLVDRSHFKYRVLIGRSAMSGIVVDPKQKYMHKPNC